MSARSRGFILVILDSLRADAVDLEPGGATPALAGIAARGLTFHRAVAPAAWTLPSHVSMLSGLYPSEHNVGSRTSATVAMSDGRARIRELVHQDRLLPPWLGTMGVKTFLGSANVWVSHASGLAGLFDDHHYVPFPKHRTEGERDARRKIDPRGKDVPRLPPGARRWVPLRVKHAGRFALERVQMTKNAFRQSIPQARWAFSGTDKGGSSVVDGLNGWLETVDGPFFAMINLIETHGPHRAPAGYGPRDVRGALAVLLRPGQRFTRRTLEHNWGDRALPDATLRRLKRAYAGEVRYADHLVARIVDRLEALGLSDQVTLAVTGDHGESFGEHGIVGHGMSLGQPVAGVPLVVVGPGIPREQVEAPVSLAALAGTVAETLVGADHPYPIPSLLRGEARGTARFEAEPPWIHFPPPRLKVGRPPEGMDLPAAAFYEGDMKLVVGSFWKEALYDLRVDPGETTSLIGRVPVPAVLRRMRDEWERLVPGARRP